MDERLAVAGIEAASAAEDVRACGEPWATVCEQCRAGASDRVLAQLCDAAIAVAGWGPAQPG